MLDREPARVGGRRWASFRGRDAARLRALLGSALVAVPFLCGCSETPIDALTRIGADDGLDGRAGESSAAGSGGAAGTTAVAGSGGAAGTTAVAGSGGAAGTTAVAGAGVGGSRGGSTSEAGAGGTADCVSPRPALGVVGIRSAATGLCLQAGEETRLSVPVPQEVAFRVELTGECGHDEWELEDEPFFPGSYILHNRERVDRDLDIEFGSSENGTRVILYVPAPSGGPILHQRFYFRQRSPGTYQIQPGHALSQCLTDTIDGLQIWPCADTSVSQEWALLPDECAGS